MERAARYINPASKRFESWPQAGHLAGRPQDRWSLAAATALQAAARAQPAAGKKRLPEPASLLRWNPLVLLFSTKGSVNSKSWAIGVKPQLAIVPENAPPNHRVFTLVLRCATLISQEPLRPRRCPAKADPLHLKKATVTCYHQFLLRLTDFNLTNCLQLNLFFSTSTWQPKCSYSI